MSSFTEPHRQFVSILCGLFHVAFDPHPPYREHLTVVAIIALLLLLFVFFFLVSVSVFFPPLLCFSFNIILSAVSVVAVLVLFVTAFWLLNTARKVQLGMLLQQLSYRLPTVKLETETMTRSDIKC